MNKRIVITGVGVVAPNGTGIANFWEALMAKSSGIRFEKELADFGFGCQVGGTPAVSTDLWETKIDALVRRKLTATGVQYGILAGIEAWENAGLQPAHQTDQPDWESGCVMGAGLAGALPLHDSFQVIDAGNMRRLPSNTTAQTMSSGVSAYLGGVLGLGNQVTTNASACSTGTEAIVQGMWRLRNGRAKRMLVGGCDSTGPYVWAAFDALRVLNRKHNDAPAAASRPMSATASGFVPGGGGGALVLETLESALDRGAPILAELAGGAVNSGGQRQGGSMTAPNQTAIARCLAAAIEDGGVHQNDIDLISGHLTATMFDPVEVALWAKALNRRGGDFPLIQALKGHFGHCLSAAGAIESVAAVLQLERQQVVGNVNCEDLHTEILKTIAPERAQYLETDQPINVIAKSSFGFGDVNSCVLFKRFKA